jgi:eukaryotic-like serine/threonine-protein kinase
VGSSRTNDGVCMDEDVALKEQCQSRIGQQLSGKWTLELLIGVGGMAAVYLGRHRNGATAAIKMLHTEFATHVELRARFQREAYIANKVDHQGAVKVLDDDVTLSGEPYLVMELLRGASVDAYAQKNGGRLPLPHTVGIVEQTLAVLECAHAAGIVHRDLKPENLFLTEQGVIKVLDFGIARLREGADTRKTRTGLLMGTPAFMAPEQALGRWSDVDGRTDLWAVGAVMFTLLTGRAVHEAETANEMIVFSATRPAPSLGRFVRGPLRLVEIVDRALAYEQGQRYASAAAMRADVRELMVELGLQPMGARPVEVAAEPPVAPGARTALGGIAVARGEAPPARPATVGSPEAPTPAETAAPKHRGLGERYDPSFATAEDIQAMQNLFVATERALVATTHYGKGHPEAARRYEWLFSQVASALMHTDVGLVWNVTPYSFAVRDQTLWEPKAPFDRIPYQLFSDGIRTAGLLPGLTETEFVRFLEILTLDRTREMAPEDDFVTLLWDASFEHVVYQAIDTFAEGDQKARAAFNRRVAEVQTLAQFDTSMQLEDCWQSQRGATPAGTGPTAAEAKRERLMRTLATAETADAESQAAAAALGRREQRPVHPGATLEADPALLQMLAARMQTETASLGERFVHAAAEAYREATRLGIAGSVSSPLRTAIDALSEKRPEMAIEMIGALCREIGDQATTPDGKDLRSALAAELVSRQTMERLLAGARREIGEESVYWEGLRTVVEYVDGTHVPVVLKVIADLSPGELMDLLVGYLGRAARGYEADLGTLFPTASVGLGLALVRVLAALATPEARQAIMAAGSSPHPVVRIEALGYVEGVSSERLRLELRNLLEDREPDVRIAALGAMREYSIRVAGPFLVLRIRSPAFDGLSFAEKQAALGTLASLAPKRAEDVCLELLTQSRMMSSEAHEQTRELAANVLGQVATTQPSVDALHEETTKRWRSSERVRAAAARALEQIRLRMTGESA